MDQKLRERILRSLRWLVTDAQWKANQSKDGDSEGYSREYSPELKEAMYLLTDLEQGQLLIDNPIEAAPMHSEQDCHDIGVGLGMSTRDIISFYLQYAPQWRRPNGKLMTDLSIEMRRWKLKGQCEDMMEPERNAQGKTPRQLDMERNG